MVHIISENAPNPPASSGWLFKKPPDSHDKFLDASSLMNVFNFTDKVKINGKAHENFSIWYLSNITVAQW